MKGRCLLVALAAGLIVVVTPGAALGVNDALSCKLVPRSLVGDVFDFPHVDGHYEAFSPTANGEAAVAGSDQSFCLLSAWDHSQPKSHKVFGAPPHFVVAPCCGAVTVETIVQDEGEEGSEYDPDELWKVLVANAKGTHEKYGGGPLKPPGPFGASRTIGFWFGSESHIAVAGYQVNDGFIQIEVDAHSDPYEKLEALAKHIVPAFAPYG